MASEMGEYYTAKRKERQEKNAERHAKNTKTLKHLASTVAGFAYQDLDRGSHLRIHFRGLVVDFWPSTGAATIVGTKDIKRGFDAGSLYRWMKRLANDRDEQARRAAANPGADR